MGQTARTDREIDADFATVTISLPSIESLLIGRSRKMAEVRRLIARVARSQASVLVTGPSGSGKEVVARCLHEASSRRGASFVAVNCGAIPRELLESGLFGNEKGKSEERRVGKESVRTCRARGWKCDITKKRERK